MRNKRLFTQYDIEVMFVFNVDTRARVHDIALTFPLLWHCPKIVTCTIPTPQIYLSSPSLHSLRFMRSVYIGKVYVEVLLRYPVSNKIYVAPNSLVLAECSIFICSTFITKKYGLCFPFFRYLTFDSFVLTCSVYL